MFFQGPSLSYWLTSYDRLTLYIYFMARMPVIDLGPTPVYHCLTPRSPISLPVSFFVCFRVYWSNAWFVNVAADPIVGVKKGCLEMS